MTHPPLFKRIPIDVKATGTEIQKAQQEFENFWGKMAKKCPRNPELTLAMRRMQEACMWYTRALALNDFADTTNGKKPDYSKAQPKPDFTGEAESEPVEKKPTIHYKKSKL